MKSRTPAALLLLLGVAAATPIFTDDPLTYEESLDLYASFNTTPHVDLSTSPIDDPVTHEESLNLYTSFNTTPLLDLTTIIHDSSTDVELTLAESRALYASFNLTAPIEVNTTTPSSSADVLADPWLCNYDPGLARPRAADVLWAADKLQNANAESTVCWQLTHKPWGCVRKMHEFDADLTVCTNWNRGVRCWSMSWAARHLVNVCERGGRVKGRYIFTEAGVDVFVH